jgi:hypothetical protein
MDGRWFEGNPVYEITDPNGGKYEVEAPAKASLQDIVAYVQKAVGSKWQHADCTKEARGPWCDYPTQLKMPRDYGAAKLVIIALLPPTLLLIFGASVYWALAGFRGAQPK